MVKLSVLPLHDRGWRFGKKLLALNEAELRDFIEGVRLSRNLCLGPHVEPEKHSARVTQPNLIVSAGPQVDA